MESRKLGKGLDFLIKKTTPAVEPEVPETATPPQPGGESPKRVSVDAIKPNTYQPRREFDIDGLNELIDSIRLHGVLQPIAVRPLADGNYELIAGERRWRASRELGLEDIPVVIHDLDDQRMLEVALIENIQREDLTPIEKAKAYRRLMSEFQLTQEEAAKRLAQKRSTVANYVRLLELPDDIQEKVARGSVSMGHARALAGVTESEVQKKLAIEAAAGMSVRDLEGRIRALKNLEKARSAAAGAGEPDAAGAQFSEIESRLRDALATKVAVKGRGRGGRLTIDYFDSAALQRIVACIEAGAQATSDRAASEGGLGD